MKLSFIIPVYNAEEYIVSCIASIYDQNIPLSEFEIVAVDDGSQDSSLEAMHKIVQSYPNIKVLHQENGGQASARNYGLEHAKGKYIMFVDADDMLIPNSLEHLISKTEQHQAQISISTMHVYQADQTYWESNDFKHYDIVVTGEQAILSGLNFGSVCARLFRRDFLMSHNLRFTTDMKHEDVLFSMMAAIVAERIISIDISTYKYTWHAGSTDRSFDTASLRKGLLSDLKIILYQKKISSDAAYSASLRNHFTKRSNSLLVSNLVCMIKCWSSLQETREEYVALAKEHKVLPIHGDSMSWKTTLLSPFLNILLKCKIL